MRRLKGFLLALIAAALLLGGCGGDDGSSAKGTQAPAPKTTPSGAQADCPFTAEQAGEAVGEEVEEVTPQDATFAGGAACQFGAAGGGNATVTYGTLGSDTLEFAKKRYSGGGPAGEVEDRPDWGQGAFVWSNDVVETKTAVGFFPTDGGAAGVNVVVDKDASVDPKQALDKLVEIVGPATG